MCSVIGFSGKYNSEVLNDVFFNSRIRGLHSFGFSYYDNENIVTEKYLDYQQFLDAINYLKPNKFIAHFRYSTSGDYKNLNNNQPITQNNKSLVFNGVIDMSNKKQIELKYNIQMETENDGEVALKIDDLVGLLKRCTFAGLFLEDGKIKAVRNVKRPLWRGTLNDNIYYASTKDILKRSKIISSEILKPMEIYYD